MSEKKKEFKPARIAVKVGEVEKAFETTCPKFQHNGRVIDTAELAAKPEEYADEIAHLVTIKSGILKEVEASKKGGK